MAKHKRKPAPEAAREPASAEEFRVVLFKEDDGTVPLLVWLDSLNSPRAVAQCLAVIELLRQYANRLVRPYTDTLRDGVRELRAKRDRIQYRILYFFHGRSAVITHGFIKRGSKVPDKEIERAVACRKRFEAASEQHTHVEE